MSLNIKIVNLIPLLFLILLVVTFSLVVVYPDGYPLLFLIFSLIYFLAYCYLIFFSNYQITIRRTVSSFVVFKLFVFVFLIVNGEFDKLIIGAEGGDPTRYHMPSALNVKENGNYFDYIFSVSTFNGRLTHILIALQMEVLDIFGVDFSSGFNVATTAYLFNAVLALLSIYFTYKAAFKYSSNILFSRRAAWFLAFNPTFIGSTSAVKKEALLFFAVSLFLYFLVTNGKALYHGVVSFFILILDRIYMIPLLASIFLFSKRRKGYLFLFLTFGMFLLIELTIGIDIALQMHASHVVSLTSVEIDNSFLDGHGHFNNALRTLFGPAFFRGILNGYVPPNTLVFSGANVFMLAVFYPLIALMSFFYTNGIHKMIFMTYLFVFVFIPFHGTFKIFMITALTPLFLDKISFVKYLRYRNPAYSIVGR